LFAAADFAAVFHDMSYRPRHLFNTPYRRRFYCLLMIFCYDAYATPYADYYDFYDTMRVSRVIMAPPYAEALLLTAFATAIMLAACYEAPRHCRRCQRLRMSSRHTPATLMPICPRVTAEFQPAAPAVTTLPPLYYDDDILPALRHI